MGKFRTKAFLFIILLILLVNFSYLFFLFQISNEILALENIDRLRTIFFLASLGVSILAIGGAIALSFYLSQGISRPISKLIKAAQAVAKRDFSYQIKMRAFSEIEELAASFNQMIHQLKGFKQEAQRHSQDLEKTIRERSRELSYIYKIGREVSSTLELTKVLETVAKRTAEVLDLKVCVILLVDEIYANRLQVSCVWGINQKKIEDEIINPEEAISGWVWSKRDALLVKDISQDSRFIGRKKERYYAGSLIAVPLTAEGKVIGVIIGNNKTSGQFFKQEDLLLLKEIAAESAIAIDNALLYRDLKEVYLHTISALAKALEAKDKYTRSHSENVTKYAVAIARELNLPTGQIDILRRACQLHDLGKIGIHDYILTKKARLSDEEWDEIRLHSLRGAEILQPISFLSEAADLVRQHHERFDGKGYPAKLSGQDIQLGARIMAAADAFDAMISGRPYRKAMGLSQATEELEANSGSQFDPGIIKVFLRVLANNPELIKPAAQPKNK